MTAIIKFTTADSSTSTPATYTYTKYVTTDALNYRTGAGTSYSRVGTFPAGTTVEVQDGYSATANGYTWYAVKVGGGTNHRFNLADGILIKDNHIVAAGSITAAVRAA